MLTPRPGRSYSHLLPTLLSLILLGLSPAAFGSEADIPLPSLDGVSYFGGALSGRGLLSIGFVVCILGGLFGLYQYLHIKKLPAHQAMLDISELIYSTCKTYLIQQGKFLAILEIFIGAIILYYFTALAGMPFGKVLIVLLWSIVGILGSYGVAWFGIRINTLANSRTAFVSLKGKPYDVLSIPVVSGMSIGLLLISVELIMMLLILLVISPDNAGACFIGFAIGESLGASALRIAGGIFTKIADIGSDLMKIVFNIKEDDARNPGVIADCTGDNAGDSVGPTADGFETYGVTGVALITFIALAVFPDMKAHLLVWIFAMRIMMIITSVVSYFVNSLYSKAKYGNASKMDFEAPLTTLVWITSLISIGVTFLMSSLLIRDLGDGSLWWKLSIIISCGTIAGALIPELTKVFTSCKSTHVNEVVTSSREGGPSLTILSGLVAGNFSAFWMGLSIAALMAIAFFTSNFGLDSIMGHPAVFAFGLVAFGFLGMGPVTIAVDSFGPVTDNAQSVYELSLIENVPNVREEIKSKFGFDPDFEHAKDFLEEADGAGNTFKATAKPVLIGTAVVGATTMIFSIIIKLTEDFGEAVATANLQIINPYVILGLISGGAVIYWFTGASMQAVSTGAYRAVDFIKKNIKLDVGVEKASAEDSSRVVQICTQYAQAGMFNIFLTVFFIALAFACFNPFFFVGYLISIATFGLFQAIFMANAGGAWDNAKKVVEVDLKMKNTPLHAATVIGDTVGDPFKDTSSVALNPIIKFTTLFGLLAVEMAVKMQLSQGSTVMTNILSAVFFGIALIFVWRSFYKMRIETSA
jgi:K(+)-stimulated pyrophosphate-energized sodium pump